VLAVAPAEHLHASGIAAFVMAVAGVVAAEQLDASGIAALVWAAAAVAAEHLDA
jgi:hypothetical protein